MSATKIHYNNNIITARVLATAHTHTTLPRSEMTVWHSEGCSDLLDTTLEAEERRDDRRR